MLSVSRQAVSNWERAVSLPDVDTLQAIAAVLQIDISALLYDEKHIDDFQSTKKKRISRTVLLGCLFIVFFILQITLVPYLYSQRMYYMTLYGIAHCMIPPVTYAIGISLLLSIISLWLDFRISSVKACRAMLIAAFSFIFLYVVFMLFSLLGPYIGIYLYQILHTGPLFNWLAYHPVIFIFPGALLFFGFHRKTPTQEDSSRPVCIETQAGKAACNK